uniref:Uncharacterized protein n=1 Tax=Arundo donax TaxID=35708 RepID=A0A0A9A9F2_ARUDO
MQFLCERCNINYSELCQRSSPRPSDRAGASKLGGTPVDAVVDVADSSHRAESPEDHVTHGTGDADADSPDDIVVNCAADARAKSLQDHD